MTWYELIRKRRQELGLSLREVASAINVSNPAIHCWEKGKTYEPIFFTFLKLLRLYDIPVEEIEELWLAKDSIGEIR